MTDWNEYFYYDESSKTCLRWRISTSTRPVAGKEAGSLSRSEDGQPKTCEVGFKSKSIKVHRIIWEMFNGPIPEGLVIDHLNGDPWDNRLVNLECKTLKNNSRNVKKNTRNKSGIVGVCYIDDKGRGFYWQASYKDHLGKNVSKWFPCKKLGYAEAFRQACEFRESGIENMKKLGHNYTDRHGK